MKNVISITNNALGNTTVPTVNVRELHAFLENGDHFATWIKERIDQYQFLENQDFVTYSASAEKGRPKVEYALSIDMAKELSMVERTEKGKQARQYFIECERRAHSGPHGVQRPASSLQPPTSNPHPAEALKITPLAVRAARAFGLGKNAAAISANQYVQKLTGVNLLQQLGHTHLQAQNQDSLYFTPTELGKRIGVSARKFNLLLAEAGFQSKRGEDWEVSDAGPDFARIYDTGKRHGSGVPIQQIKWAEQTLPLLQIAEIEE